MLDDDYLVLSTIHSAKGCEWDAVHVIHAADGMIPSGMATGSDDGIAEERRLFYVALTRARRMLYLYWPRRYYHRRAGHDDAHNYAQITRFLPDEVQALLDHETRGPSPTEVSPSGAQDVRGTVDAALGALFR